MNRLTGNKLCPSCGLTKPSDEFHANKSRADGLANTCKACRKAYGEAKLDTVIREAYLKRAYGLTLDEFNTKLQEQGGLCAICRVPTDRRLHVDHDHTCCTTKARSCGRCVRGLLCDRCNNGLGSFGDSPETLQAAIDYLDSHTQEQTTSPPV
jgi:hypothetical protein